MKTLDLSRKSPASPPGLKSGSSQVRLSACADKEPELVAQISRPRRWTSALLKTRISIRGARPGTHPTRLLPCLFPLLCLLPLLLLTPAASADRASQPLGVYIQQSEIVAVADAEPAGEGGYDTRLTFREILKGDPALAGQSDVRSLPHSSESVWIAKDAKGVLVLLGADWRKPGQDAVIEAYTKPADIGLVRALIPIYALPTEAGRLQTLISHLADADPRWHEEVFSALARMRDPANYPLLTGLYPALDITEKRQLITLIGTIGDPRGLPTVFEAAHADDFWLRNESLRVLTYQFPGAPGVAEAVRGLLKDPKLAPSAAQYLLAYTPGDAELKKFISPPYVARSPLAVVEDVSESGYSRRADATALLPKADAALKARMRRALLPLLTRDAAQGNWLEAEDAAGLLRTFHHPDCLPALLTLLVQKPGPFLPDKAWRVAAQAIRELGPGARSQASALLLDKIKEQGADRDKPLSLDRDHDNQHFLALAWLGTPSEYQEAKQLMDPRYQEMWATYLPLAGVSQAHSEADFLLPLLLHPPAWPENAQTMVMTRLGALHEKRAVPALLASLATNPWYGLYAAQDALIALGGPEVQQGALRLLAQPGATDARRMAFAILEAHPTPLLLPLLRKMVLDADPAVRADALGGLSRLGTPDDLKTLLPMADFWTGDPINHNSAREAVVEIWSRCHYDVNGPVPANVTVTRR